MCTKKTNAVNVQQQVNAEAINNALETLEELQYTLQMLKQHNANLTSNKKQLKQHANQAMLMYADELIYNINNLVKNTRCLQSYTLAPNNSLQLVIQNLTTNAIQHLI